jgi:hypothetical protein
MSITYRNTSKFTIHPSVDGSLDCFCILIIMNSSAMTVRVQIVLWGADLVPFGYIQERIFQDHRVVLTPVFWETIILFSIMAIQFTFLQIVYIFSTSSSTFVIFLFLILAGTRWYCTVFNLYFHNDSWGWTLLKICSSAICDYSMQQNTFFYFFLGYTSLLSLPQNTKIQKRLETQVLMRAC